MLIENPKTYKGTEVEQIFFRPSFCGKSAEGLGIRILYNMPIPTKVPTFGHNYNILADSDALKAEPEKFEHFRSNYPVRRELKIY